MAAKTLGKRYLLIALLAGVLGVYLYAQTKTSEFDTFAKQTIRELRHGNGGDLIATPYLLAFLTEREITDIPGYLSDNIKTHYEYQIDAPGLSKALRNHLTTRGATKLTVFSSTYFPRLIAHYEMRILVYESPSKPREIEAHVFFHSL